MLHPGLSSPGAFREEGPMAKHEPRGGVEDLAKKEAESEAVQEARHGL